MIFLLRANGPAPQDPGVRVVAEREAAGLHEFFCVAAEADFDRLGGSGAPVVRLRDGWYAGDGQGGVAIWGYGRYWEVRDTPFTIVEAAGPGGHPAVSDAPRGGVVDVRGQIFGAVP